MHCSNCGRKLKGNERFCKYCGHALAPLRESAAFRAGSRPAKRNRARIVAVVALAFLCLCIGVLALFFTVAPGMFGDDVNSGGDGRNDSGQPGTRLISFEDLDVPVSGGDDAKAALTSLSEMLEIDDMDSTIHECRIEELLDDTYYRFAQYYDEYPVYGHEITLGVGSDGKAFAAMNGLAEIGSIDTSVRVDADGALMSIAEYEADATLESEPVLMVCQEPGGGYCLAYSLDVSAEDVLKRCFVSARTGEVIHEEQLTCDEQEEPAEHRITAYDAGKRAIRQIPKTGTDEYGRAYTFDIERGRYHYVDPQGDRVSGKGGRYGTTLEKGGKVIARYAGVETYDFLFDDGEERIPEVDLGNLSESDGKTVALVENANAAFDFYHDVLGRTSYNGKGGLVTLVSNAKLPKYGNANAYSGSTSPYQTSLVFGFENAVLLETVGHEFSHSVEMSICAMEYAGESGSIKEGAADVFGELIEDYRDNGEMDGSCDWVHGRRNMVSPQEGGRSGRHDGGEGYPSSYQQPGFWGDTSDGAWDHGHVHNNSTVISHAAYLMCAGELRGEPISTQELARIMLASYGLCPYGCSFTCYAGIMELNALLRLGAAKAERVVAAFDAVGISPLQTAKARLRAAITPGASSEALLGDFATRLNAEDHTVEYQYRARGYANNPSFEWVVSSDLPYGTVVGTHIADFDGDGEQELLSVVWRNGAIDLEMHEVVKGSVKRIATMSDDVAFPCSIEGDVSLDVATDAVGAIFIQWWKGASPIASMFEWSVVRVDFDGEGFTMSDAASVAGTGLLSLRALKSDMAKLGLSVDYVPDQDAGDFLRSSLTQLDGSLSLIAHAKAWVDSEAVAEQVYAEMQEAGDEWGDLGYLGEFSIGPRFSPWGPNDNLAEKATTHSNEETARLFMEAWYGDWRFENGVMVVAEDSVPERCLRYIAPGSELYDDFAHTDEHPSSPTASSYSRGVAFCALEVNSLESHEENTCRVEVWFVGTQNSVDQSMYDHLCSEPWRDVYDLGFDDSGQIVSITSVVRMEGGPKDNR